MESLVGKASREKQTDGRFTERGKPTVFMVLLVIMRALTTPSSTKPAIRWISFDEVMNTHNRKDTDPRERQKACR